MSGVDARNATRDIQHDLREERWRDDVTRAERLVAAFGPERGTELVDAIASGSSVRTRVGFVQGALDVGPSRRTAGRRTRSRAMEWMHRIIASPPRASDAAVAAAERAIGVRLPPDHVEIARVHQGAMPIPGDIERDDFDTGVEYLYHFEAEPSPSNIVNAFSIHAGRLPDGVVPFAAGIGGDVFCFDYRRDPERPTVAVSLHDNRVSFAELAPSFGAFLALLSES